jgi:hypothetical protein
LRGRRVERAPAPAGALDHFLRRLAADGAAEADQQLVRQRVDLDQLDIGIFQAAQILLVGLFAEREKILDHADLAEAVLERRMCCAWRGLAPDQDEPARSLRKIFQWEGIVAFHWLSYFCVTQPSL